MHSQRFTPQSCPSKPNTRRYTAVPWARPPRPRPPRPRAPGCPCPRHACHALPWLLGRPAQHPTRRDTVATVCLMGGKLAGVWVGAFRKPFLSCNRRCYYAGPTYYTPEGLQPSICRSPHDMQCGPLVPLRYPGALHRQLLNLCILSYAFEDLRCSFR